MLLLASSDVFRLYAAGVVFLPGFLESQGRYSTFYFAMTTAQAAFLGAPAFSQVTDLKELLWEKVTPLISNPQVLALLNKGACHAMYRAGLC